MLSAAVVIGALRVNGQTWCKEVQPQILSLETIFKSNEHHHHSWFVVWLRFFFFGNFLNDVLSLHNMTIIHIWTILHERSFHMKFMKQAFGEFHKFHMK